jgi:sec-independent protein translocase protein TatB
MFGIGMPEMLLILAIALIVIGPKKLPDLAKSLGKALGEFKKATSELKDSIQIDSELKEVKTTFDDLNRDLKKSPIVTDKEDERQADDTASKDALDEDPPPSGEALDELKTAFARNQTDVQAGDAPQGDDGSSVATPPDSETQKE